MLKPVCDKFSALIKKTLFIFFFRPLLIARLKEVFDFYRKRKDSGDKNVYRLIMAEREGFEPSSPVLAGLLA